MNANYFTSIIPIKTIKTFCFLLVISFFISVSSYGQENRIGPFVDQLTGAGSFKTAAGVTNLHVQSWGAGGGGGGSAGLLSLVELGQAGGGGGGGAFSSKNISISWPTPPVNPSFDYSVGKGGAGGSTDNVNGANGDESFFKNATVTVKAGGGGGGKGSVLITNTGAGLGSTDGDKNGGNGGAAYLIPLSLFQTGINRSGGGGGSAGTSLNGNSASGLTGGIAVTGGAAGGNGGQKTGSLLGSVLNLVLSDDVLGSPGGFPGGGGGGGVGNGLVNGLLGGLLNPGAKNSNGGKGGEGKITVGYTCPTYSVTGFNTDASCTQTSTIVLTGNLPRGTYEISYTISSGPEVTVSMVVSTANTANITVTGIPIAGLSTVTITRIKSENCWTKVNFPIVFDRPTIPTVITKTRPICTLPTGSVNLSGLSDLSTWTINATPDTIGLTGLSGTGKTTTTISGLTPGITYSFTVSHGTCTSAPFLVAIDPLPTKTWNGTAWSPDPLIIPTIEEKVIFESNYDKDESVTACSCEVKSGADVTFKMEDYLKLRNELKVNTGGSLTFKNNASLVQINDVNKNKGVITYERETKVSRYDYTYWSSPVKGWTLKELSKNTLFDRYFSYDPDKGWEVSMSGVATMLARHGYIVRGPQTYSITQAADFTGKFTGIPNNGTFEEDLILKGNKDYLLGNPYPSAISADEFLKANSDIYSGSDLIKPAVLKGTLYFWTHNSPPVADPGTTTYKYAGSDYASYNRTGGVGTIVTGGATKGGFPPSGKIAAGQGFFAPTTENGGKIVFNNSMRLLNDEVIDNSQFFKLGTTSKSTNEIEKNRVWLNLTNEEGAFKQTLIGYVTGATNGYEGSFDGVSYDGNTFVDFYSVNNDVNLTIQGRALPFEQKDSVSLGYRSTIKGEFQISIDQKDGKLLNQQVFLEDQLVQVLHDLKTPYSFETEIGTFNDRFMLRYVDKNAITENIDDLQVTTVSIATKDKKIDIKTTESVIDKIYIYDFSGNFVYSDAEINATTIVISNLLVDHSALIVHVVLENGKKIVKKIMY